MALTVTAWIEKVGMATFGAADSSGSPYGTITAVNTAGLSFTRNGNSCAFNPAVFWESETNDTAILGIELWCGSVFGVAIVDGGEGFSTAPTATATGITLGTPVLATGVTSVTVNTPGSGFAPPPSLIFTGGGGSGAAGYVITRNGKIVAAVVTNGGTGYTSAPTISLSSLPDSGGVVATLAATVSGGAVTEITVTNMGLKYTNPPTVTVQATTGINGPNGNTSADYMAVVYDALGSDGAGANAGGIRAVIPDLGGGRPSCGTGYTGTTATVTVAGGSGVSLTGNVSKYVVSIPVTSGGTDLNNRPAITVSGGGSSRSCSAVAMMSGPIASDVFTYTAPASFITALIGASSFTSASATGAAMTNSVGVQESAIGPMVEASKPITLDVGINLGSFAIDPGSQSFTAANLMLKGIQWVPDAGASVISYQSDGSTPATWTLPTSTVLRTSAGNSLDTNLVDSMGGPYYLGKYTFKYTDANVNTSSAQAVWAGVSGTQTTITPVPLSGDVAPVTIPWGNVTISGGSITAVSLTTPTPVTFGAGYQAAGIFIGSTGASTFAASVRCAAGAPTNVDIHCGGTGFSTGSPQTLVIYGTALAGNEVTAQFDCELNGSQTSWTPGVQFRTANKSGTWSISNPIALAPGGGVPNVTTPPSQLATAPHILASLTAANGRPVRRIRYMDRTTFQGCNFVLPSDYAGLLAAAQSTNNKWRTLLSNPIHQGVFRYARIINTDPAKGPGPTGDGTYASVTTRMYTNQAWAQFFDSTYTLSATTTSGSPVVACTNMVNGSSALMAGGGISGTGIPAGAYVAFFGMQTTGTLASGSPTIAGIPHADALILSALVALGNMDIVLTNTASGLPTAVQVTAVDTSANTLTLSANATASGPQGFTVADNLCFTMGGPAPTWGFAAATASGSITMTVQDPGYISLPTGDMGLSVQNHFGTNSTLVAELRSVVPHGICWPQAVMHGDVGLPITTLVNTTAALNPALSISGTITNGSPTITGVTNAFQFSQGMAVYNPACITTGTRILSVNAGANTITLDANAIGNGSSAIVTGLILTAAGQQLMCYVSGPFTIAFYAVVASSTTGSILPPSGNAAGPQWVNSNVEIDLSSTAFPAGWVANFSVPFENNMEPCEYGVYLSKELGDSTVHRNLPVMGSDALHYMLGYRDALQRGPNTVIHLETGNELWNNGNGFPAGVWCFGITTQMTYVTSGTINGHATAPLSSSLSGQVTAHVLTAARAYDQYISGWTAAGGDPTKVVRGVGSWWGGPGNSNAITLSNAVMNAGSTYNAGFKVAWVAPYLTVPSDTAVIRAMAPYGSPVGGAGGWAIPRINGWVRNWILYNIVNNAVTATHAGIFSGFGVALASYEGDLQNPVPNPVPNQAAITHDMYLHASAAELSYAWYQAFGTAGGTGAEWFSCYFGWTTTNTWLMAPNTSVLPGLDPNAAMATYQGGAPSDQHDHWQLNTLSQPAVAPLLQGMLNALQDMGPYTPPGPALAGQARSGAGALMMVI